MKLHSRFNTLNFLMVGLLAVSQSTLATNGLFTHGYGTASKALAGAGVATSFDSLAAATNPAGMVNVGSRAEFAAALFSPRREYDINGAVTGFVGPHAPTESGRDYFAVPSGGYNRMLGENSSIGVTVFGNGGMNTMYPASANPGFGAGGTFGGGSTGVDYMQLFIAPTYSHRFGNNVSVGISPLLGFQRLELNGVTPFTTFSNSAANMSNRGHDTALGLGVRVGLQAQVTPRLSFGASYQSEVNMEKFDKYKGLFAEGGNMDVPATGAIGLAFKTSDTSLLVFDVQHIWYENVPAIGNPIGNLFTGCNKVPLTGVGTAGCFGGSNGAGFGWKDMTIFKIGYQWQSSPDWTWRVGFSHGSQPIPASEVLLNIIAPGVIENHVTFGFTKTMGKSGALNFAATYAMNNEVNGNAPAFFGGQPVKLEMHQFELEIGWSWKF